MNLEVPDDIRKWHGQIHLHIPAKYVVLEVWWPFKYLSHPEQ